MDNKHQMRFLQELEHINWLIAKGIHPLEIADQLIHIMLDIMRESFKNKFPNATDKEIIDRMREQVNLYKNLKHNRRKRIYG